MIISSLEDGSNLLLIVIRCESTTVPIIVVIIDHKIILLFAWGHGEVEISSKSIFKMEFKRLLIGVLLQLHVFNGYVSSNEDITESFDESDLPSNINLCPDVSACSCFNSGLEVRAECFGTSFTFIPAELPLNVTELIISRTGITELKSDNISFYSGLKTLEIKENTIVYIEDGFLSSLTNLESISLKHNLITAVPGSIFQSNKELKSIDLSDNHLTNLPSITHLDKLLELTVSENHLYSLSANMFNGLQRLERLYMDNNKLAGIDQNAFTGLTALNILDLNNNIIGALNTQMLDPLQNLADLNLAHNSIQRLEFGVFSGPGSSLINMDLSHNNIDYVDNDAFAGLSELDDLRLDYNQLTYVPKNAIRTLTRLDDLYLSGNPIENIEANSFDGIAELKELRLNNLHDLTEVHKDAFLGIPDLNILYLSNNPNLTAFTPDHLPDAHLSKVVYLYLSNNGFTYMSKDVFKNKPGLSRVDLHGNPFRCDCSIQWMAEVVQDNTRWALHWSQDGSAPRCDTPEHLSTYKMAALLPQDLTCEAPEVRRLTPPVVQATRHRNATLQFGVRNGLPATYWITPDGKAHHPLRFPPNDYLAFHNPQANRFTISETYTTNHEVIATLEYENTTDEDVGTYTMVYRNIEGSSSITVDLEVIDEPPGPTPSSANGVKTTYCHIFVLLLVSCFHTCKSLR